MAGRREKARFGDARQFGLSLGGVERFCRAPPFGYVFIGNDDAFRLLVAGAVGHDPAHEPGAALAKAKRMGSDMTQAALSPLIAGVPRILGASMGNRNGFQGPFRVCNVDPWQESSLAGTEKCGCCSIEPIDLTRCCGYRRSR